MNFVPSDIHKEYGENGIWTGKLYEWNLNGDTLYVQKVEKSVLKDRYCIKNPSNISMPTNQINLKNSSLSSPNSQTLSRTFWERLADWLADAVGWIGNLFGWSRPDYDYWEMEFEWRLNIDLTCILGCGEPSEGGGPSSYSTWDFKIYDTYAPGYTGQGSEGQISGGVYNFSPYGNTGGPGNSIPMEVQVVNSLLYGQDLVPVYLENNPDLAIELYEMLEEEGFTEEAKIAAKVTIYADQTNFNASDLYRSVAINNGMANAQLVDVTVWRALFSMQCALLKSENPGWSDRKVTWMAVLGVGQLILDIAGKSQ